MRKLKSQSAPVLEIFEELRGNGTALYYARYVVKTSYLFGCFKIIESLWVKAGRSGSFYLSTGNYYKESFLDFASAQKAAVKALDKYQYDQSFHKVVHFKKLQ